jgi:hypothetical protein
MSIELVAGKKITGVGLGRKPHKMRRDTQKSGKPTVLKYDKGTLVEIQLPDVEAPYRHLVELGNAIHSGA